MGTFEKLIGAVGSDAAQLGQQQFTNSTLLRLLRDYGHPSQAVNDLQWRVRRDSDFDLSNRVFDERLLPFAVEVRRSLAYLPEALWQMGPKHPLLMTYAELCDNVPEGGHVLVFKLGPATGVLTDLPPLDDREVLALLRQSQGVRLWIMPYREFVRGFLAHKDPTS